MGRRTSYYKNIVWTEEERASAVQVDSPGAVFRLGRYARFTCINGWDDDGRLRCVITAGPVTAVHVRGPRGGNREIYRGSAALKSKFLLLVWLLTLRWTTPGGWKGSPLELLALSAE